MVRKFTGVGVVAVIILLVAFGCDDTGASSGEKSSNNSCQDSRCKDPEKPCYVEGYRKDNGTWVDGYCRKRN